MKNKEMKTQNTMPSVMRYNRVEQVLQDDLALRRRLGPKDCPIDRGFGTTILYSKEVVDVTEAIHRAGKDAHRIAKSEILTIANKLTWPADTSKVELGALAVPATTSVVEVPTKASISADPVPVAPEPAPAEPVVENAPDAKPVWEELPPTKVFWPDGAAPLDAVPAATPSPSVKVWPDGLGLGTKVGAKSTPGSTAKEPVSDPMAVLDVNLVSTPVDPVPVPKRRRRKSTVSLDELGRESAPAPATTPAPAASAPTSPAASSRTAKAVSRLTRSGVPKSASSSPADDPSTGEIPLERRPLGLPIGYDPAKYPHYGVQSPVYSLLLAALSMAEYHEKYPGFEERQRLLDNVVKLYGATCDKLRI